MQYPLSDVIGNSDNTNAFLTGPIEGFIHDNYDIRKLFQSILRERSVTSISSVNKVTLVTT